MEPHYIIKRPSVTEKGTFAMNEQNRYTFEVDVRAGKDDIKNLSGNHPLDGARVSNILPGLADEMNLDQVGGVIILSVRNGSPAQSLGFKPGDIIVSVSGEETATVVQVEKLLGVRQRLWQMAVKRGDRVLQLQVPG